MSDDEEAKPRRSKRKRSSSNLAENEGEEEDKVVTIQSKKPKTNKPKATRQVMGNPSEAVQPMRKTKNKTELASAFTPNHGSKDATQALAALYKRIIEDPNYKKDGFSVDFVDDNMVS